VFHEQVQGLSLLNLGMGFFTVAKSELKNGQNLPGLGLSVATDTFIITLSLIVKQ
jgi:hypothetical protein